MHHEVDTGFSDASCWWKLTVLNYCTLWVMCLGVMRAGPLFEAGCWVLAAASQVELHVTLVWTNGCGMPVEGGVLRNPPKCLQWIKSTGRHAATWVSINFPLENNWCQLHTMKGRDYIIHTNEPLEYSVLFWVKSSWSDFFQCQNSTWIPSLDFQNSSVPLHLLTC